MKRRWPKDGSPLHFEALTAPLIKAVKFSYEMKRKNQTKNIPWNGPTLGNAELVTSLSPRERLLRKNLKWVLEDQGRDALEEIIALALQLGIEQGRRIGGSVYETACPACAVKLRFKEDVYKCGGCGETRCHHCGDNCKCKEKI